MPAARLSTTAQKTKLPVRPYTRPVKAATPAVGSDETRRGRVTTADLTMNLKGEWTSAELHVQGVPFPTDAFKRSRFRRRESGKPLTAHQWKVYDFVMGIPRGKVTTYGVIAQALESSAQSVGGALRDNPFPPEVPCHRVIASDLFVGGYQGEWVGPDASADPNLKTLRRSRKLKLLEEEGVQFDQEGYLLGGEAVVWKP